MKLELKNRVYKLTNNKTPLSCIIPSRNSQRSPLLYFDEEKGYGRKEMAIAPNKMDAATLSDEQAEQLGEIGLKIEEVFGFPQDIEWAYEKGELFILQSRNIRTLKE